MGNAEGPTNNEIWFVCEIDATMETEWDSSLEDAITFIGENAMDADVMFEIVENSKLNIEKVYSIEDRSRFLVGDLKDLDISELLRKNYVYGDSKYIANRLLSKVNRSKKLLILLPFIFGIATGWLMVAPLSRLDLGFVKLLALILGKNFDWVDANLATEIVFIFLLGLLLLYRVSNFLFTKFLDTGDLTSKYYRGVIKTRLSRISSGELKAKTLTNLGLSVGIIVEGENLESRDKLKSIITNKEFSLADLGQFHIKYLNFYTCRLRGVRVYTAGGDLVNNKNVLPYGYRRHYDGSNAFALISPKIFYTVLYIHLIAVLVIGFFNHF